MARILYITCSRCGNQQNMRWSSIGTIQRCRACGQKFRADAPRRGCLKWLILIVIGVVVCLAVCSKPSPDLRQNHSPVVKPSPPLPAQTPTFPLHPPADVLVPESSSDSVPIPFHQPSLKDRYSGPDVEATVKRNLEKNKIYVKD